MIQQMKSLWNAVFVIDNDANSFIYPRTFGGNVEVASERVSAAVKSSKAITLTTLKHFPGHGETISDSHSSIPATDISYSDWLNYDAKPFIAGIDAGADFVMFGHLLYSTIDDLPASLSNKWHKILAVDLNFKGLSITDDMIMLQNSGDGKYADPIENAIMAILAGNDILLYVLDHGDTASDITPDDLINGIVNAVNDKRLDVRKINDSVEKILDVRYNLNNIQFHP